MDNKSFENKKISSSAEGFILDINTIMGSPSGVLINRIEVSGIKCILLSFDGMTSLQTMTQLILRPLEEIEIRRATPYELKSHIKSKLIFSNDTIECFTYGEMKQNLCRDLFFFL